MSLSHSNTLPFDSLNPSNSIIDILSALPENQYPELDIYTDGACSGNPGPGGWGAVICYNKQEMDLYGGEKQTTNNRMEMRAAIESLNLLPHPAKINLYTDSRYVQDGITKWMINWKQKGWLTADKKPVKNRDLWEQLDAAIQRHKIQWYWVKGHNGHVLNERADALARAGIVRQEMQNGY